MHFTSKARIARKSAASSKTSTAACGRKTQCLHPDKPAMFACADCPRRNSKAAMDEGLNTQPVAAFVGEEVATNACGRKTQCLHPDKPAMFACADCPRRNSKAAMDEGLNTQPMAVAAFVGEEVATNACDRKTQCLHPDKPAMFACADCPRRNNKAAMDEGLDTQPMAVAAFVGEEVATNACGRKTQCLHPDKPAMFACADCPRRNSKAAMDEGLDTQTMAVAAFVGEEVATNACGRKTQCLHPDKPAMFACADCPRRNSKAAMDEGLDTQPMAVAAFVGEEVATNACGRKTQCLHPDKPAMFACADCPRRNSKAAMDEGLDTQPIAVAAFVGEEVATNACGRKTQCLHPDKPAMFACADCPRRNSKAAMDEGLDTQPMAVAAFVGEEVAANACGRKTQCLHPDKPAMFTCADCPRRNSKATMDEGLDTQPMAVAAFVGEEVATNACGRKTQCLHPDKPAMFACADCPRRNSKAAMDGGFVQPMANP